MKAHHKNTRGHHTKDRFHQVRVEQILSVLIAAVSLGAIGFVV